MCPYEGAVVAVAVAVGVKVTVALVAAVATAVTLVASAVGLRACYLESPHSLRGSKWDPQNTSRKSSRKSSSKSSNKRNTINQPDVDYSSQPTHNTTP